MAGLPALGDVFGDRITHRAAVLGVKVSGQLIHAAPQRRQVITVLHCTSVANHGSYRVASTVFFNDLSRAFFM